MTVDVEARRTTARSARTRAAVLDALEALVREGDPAPPARVVASRAGVSVRSVFAHFSSLEELHAAMADRVIAQVVDLIEPIDHHASLTRRVVALCEQRATINEHIAPLRRAAALQRATSPALAEVREQGRRSWREQLATLFEPELSVLDEGTRTRTVATLTALMAGETWDQLTTEDGLGVEEAVLATSEAVTAVLLAVSPRQQASGNVGESLPPDSTDVQIDRLLEAIEAGAPVELVAPRLRSLRERRTGPASGDRSPGRNAAQSSTSDIAKSH